MEKYEITKERILEAAEKCRAAEATLKILFPEVFEAPKELVSIVLVPRSGGAFDNKAWSLLGVLKEDERVTWSLLDDNGFQVLVCSHMKEAIEKHKLIK